jgi:Tat protein secretion system quality control protein TatD with DNase activity
MLVQLRALVAILECITVGEIGIDMTTSCSCPQPFFSSRYGKDILHSKIELFTELLVLAIEGRKPVVIQCRDQGSGEDVGYGGSCVP